MIKLTCFDRQKIEGFILYTNNDYDGAIKAFNKALEIKEDPQIYNQLALCYCIKREYIVAQEYTLKAIKLGYDSYSLFVRITIGNLNKFSDAIKVLKEGIHNERASACIEMARLHLGCYDEIASPDICEASSYLEKAHVYAKVHEKPLIINKILNIYRFIYNLDNYNPNKFYFRENKISKYYNLAFKYHSFSTNDSNHSLINAFNDLDKMDDNSIIQYLFDNYSSDSLLIFGLLLLEEEIGDSTFIVLKPTNAFECFLEGSKNYKNAACCYMLSFYYLDLFGASFHKEKEAKKLLIASKRNEIVIPERFKYLLKRLEEGSIEEFNTSEA